MIFVLAHLIGWRFFWLLEAEFFVIHRQAEQRTEGGCHPWNKTIVHRPDKISLSWLGKRKFLVGSSSSNRLFKRFKTWSCNWGMHGKWESWRFEFLATKMALETRDWKEEIHSFPLWKIYIIEVCRDCTALSTKCRWLNLKWSEIKSTLRTNRYQRSRDIEWWWHSQPDRK